MNVAIAAKTDGLNRMLGRYIELAKKLPQEALAKQGTKLAFELANRLMPLMPAKGAVREAGIEMLKSGRGIRVRPAVRERLMFRHTAHSDIASRQTRYGKSSKTGFRRKGKTLNFQALAVQAELNVRERGRGYTQHVARIGNLKELGNAWSQVAAGSRKQKFHRGRYNQLLASAGLMVSEKNASLTLLYGSKSTEAGSALSTPRAQKATEDAIGAVTDDMGVYVLRKLRERGIAA
ncbi:MAG: hypothetical protein J0L84_03205 [Verrucomicrobia bacterium]|nr:hypothetical protein [Verrucomicrobiota bacterium]